MNIILQHFDGKLRPLDELSMANMQEYAKLVGADYELVTGRPFRRHLTGACQKVYMKLSKSGRVCDVITPNRLISFMISSILVHHLSSYQHNFKFT